MGWLALAVMVTYNLPFFITNSIVLVLRIFDGNTLDEVITGNHKLDRKEWMAEKPKKNTQIED